MRLVIRRDSYTAFVEEYTCDNVLSLNIQPSKYSIDIYGSLENNELYSYRFDNDSDITVFAMDTK